MDILGLVLSAAGSVMQLQQGRQQKAAYEAQSQALQVQAEWTRFDAKTESLKHRKQAADEMEKTLLTLARINAAAGDGHMNPLTGNPSGLHVRGLSVGGMNTGMAADNAIVQMGMGNAQAEMQLHQAGRARMAGKAAMTTAITGSVMTLGMGVTNYAQVKTPGSLFQWPSFGTSSSSVSRAPANISGQMPVIV